jgi:hypothetical protein
MDADDWSAWADGTTWRDRAPAFADLPELLTGLDVAQILGISRMHVRNLQRRRQDLDAAGETGPNVMALPANSTLTREPILWSAESIITWGVQTGRLNPITGETRRLYSPGRPRT